MDPLEIFQEAAASMVSPILLTLSGSFICYKKWFDSVINAQILLATTEFMLPLYILFTLPRVYESNNIWELWPLMISPMIILPLLGLMGYFLVWLVDIPKNQRFSIASMYSFSSIGNISILIVKSCCSTYGSLHREDTCDISLPYICMMWLPFNIVMFLMACPLFKKESGFNEESIWNILLHKLLLPLPVAAVVANAIGIIPGMNWFLFNEDSPGYMLSDCAIIVGYTGILFSQMIVGSNMTLNAKEKVDLDKGKIIWIALTRSIFTPAVVLLYVYLMWIHGALYDDRVMAFGIFIGLSSPPSFMILTMMKEFKMDTRDATLIKFWIFGFSVVTMTLSIFFFFLLI